MKAVKFIRAPLQSEGGAFKEGEVVTLEDGAAERWIIRGAAIAVKGEKKAVEEAKPAVEVKPEPIKSEPVKAKPVEAKKAPVKVAKKRGR
jgi:hypothetical protein